MQGYSSISLGVSQEGEAKVHTKTGEQKIGKILHYLDRMVKICHEWTEVVLQLCGEYFLVTLLADHCLNSTAWLNMVADHVRTFMTTVFNVWLQWDNESCVTNLKSSPTGFLQSVHCTQVSSAVSRSQSRRSALGCGETGMFSGPCSVFATKY